MKMRHTDYTNSVRVLGDISIEELMNRTGEIIPYQNTNISASLFSKDIKKSAQQNPPFQALPHQFPYTDQKKYSQCRSTVGSGKPLPFSFAMVTRYVQLQKMK
jgi:hypothetical protein